MEMRLRAPVTRGYFFLLGALRLVNAASPLKQKSFELERKGGTFFQADGKRGRMDYPSLRWRGKSSRGSEFRRENRLAVQVFRNSSVQP